MDSNAKSELELKRVGANRWLDQQQVIPSLEERVAYLERAVDLLQEADVERQAEMQELTARFEVAKMGEWTSIGVGDGKMAFVMYDGHTFQAAEVQAAEKCLREAGDPMPFTNAVRQLAAAASSST